MGRVVLRGTEQKGGLLLLLIVTLVVFCVLVLALDSHMWTRVSRKSIRTFQAMAGGLGMGAIAAPVWNIINFDPRLSAVDDSTLWPIAGGYPFGPDRTATVTYFQETPKNQIVESESGD